MTNDLFILNPLEFHARDDNGVGFFGYPPRPAPSGTGMSFK